MKSRQRQLFDRRLSFELAAFYNKFKGLQASVADVSGTTGAVLVSIANVGGAVSKGIELESRLRLTRQLSAGLELSILDSYYTNYRNAGGSAYDVALGHPIVDLTGAKTRYAPD